MQSPANPGKPKRTGAVGGRHPLALPGRKRTRLWFGQNFGALGVILFGRDLVGPVAIKQPLKLCLLGGRNWQRRCLNRLQPQFFSRIISVELVHPRHHFRLDCGRSRLYRADGNGLGLRRGGRCRSNRRNCRILLVQFGHFLFQRGPRPGLSVSVGSRRRCLDRFRAWQGLRFGSPDSRSRVDRRVRNHDHVCRLAWLFLHGAGRNDHNWRRGGLGRLRFQRVHFFHQCRARGGLRRSVFSPDGDETHTNGCRANRRK